MLRRNAFNRPVEKRNCNNHVIVPLFNCSISKIQDGFIVCACVISVCDLLHRSEATPVKKLETIESLSTLVNCLK